MTDSEAANTEAQTQAPVETVDVREWLGEQRIVRLSLDGEIYTLRITKNDRLILTK
ncbi:hemin uptake protein HemP [Myxococcota bacterium]|nr:hemin uptake protein HemP [Myxococcota bacterium]